MPKLKTHRGAMKRFKLTASGKVKAKRARGRHLLTKKSRTNKRDKKALIVLQPCDGSRMKSLISS